MSNKTGTAKIARSNLSYALSNKSETEIFDTHETKSDKFGEFHFFCYFNWKNVASDRQAKRVLLEQENLPISQMSPVQKDVHSHRNPPTRSIQVPPFLHGESTHSSISVRGIE